MNVNHLDAIFEKISPQSGILFSGGSGYGKSVNALRLINKFNIPWVAKIEDLNRLRKKSKRIVVLYEEAQNLSKEQQQELLLIMDKGYKYIVYRDSNGQPDGYTAQITFIFCSTDPGSIIEPIRTRCYSFQLPMPTEQEIFDMMKQKYPIKDKDLIEISKRCKCNPRTANRICEDFVKFGYSAFEYMGIDNRGFTVLDRRYLRELLERGSASVGVLAQTLSLKPSDVTECVERYMIAKGYVAISSKGRSLTDSGIELVESLEEK
jgi:Holliday junction DNA helicase RuvB